MAVNVRQAFLHDAKEGRLHVAGQSPKILCDLEPNPHTAAFSESFEIFSHARR
jgi:hypothetical protein